MPSDRVFRHLSYLLKKNPLLNNSALNKEAVENKIISNTNSIKPRAFLKVVTWMKKLCHETLEFSHETLEISIRILKQYLENSS